jgi:hypothetical protein
MFIALPLVLNSACRSGSVRIWSCLVSPLGKLCSHFHFACQTQYLSVACSSSCRCSCFAFVSAVWPYTVQIVKFFKVILKKTYQGNLYPMEVDFKPNAAHPADPNIGDFSVGCAVGVNVVSYSIVQQFSAVCSRSATKHACVPYFAQQVSGGAGMERTRMLVMNLIPGMWQGLRARSSSTLC